MHGPDSSTAYRFDEFRLDPTVLTYRGVVVPLTPKAVDTLHLLVKKSPAVVSKEEIISAVWPDTFVVESSLARNISVIRKALEQCSPSLSYIETIPKRGYRFVAAVTPETGEETLAKQRAALPRAHRWGVRAWLVAMGVLILIVAGAGSFYRSAASRGTDPDPSTLIGWHLFHKVSPAELEQALLTFEKAVAANPQSAMAHAGLSATLLTLPRLAKGGADSFARARESAHRAVLLDPNLGAAHASKGAAQMIVEHDFAAAEKSLRRAIELDSRSSFALVNLSQLLCGTRRLDEALTVAKRAAVIDPVSPMIGVQVGIVLYSQRRFEEAARQLQSVLARERGFSLAHYYLGLTYGYLGKYDEALDHWSKAELHPGVLRTDRAWLALRRGDRSAAEEVYRQLQAEVGAGSLPSSALILLASALGFREDGFRELEKVFEERRPELLNVQSDPRLEELRADARYPALVRRLLASRAR